MKYYYLINNRIMKADNDMPLETNYNDYDLTMYYLDYKQWHQSLQPCEITESELEKVKDNIFERLNKHEVYFDVNNPIEITDIVEEKLNVQEPCAICHKTIREQSKGCNLIECYKGRQDYNKVVLVFKSPYKVESNEVVECNDNNIDKFINKYVKELPENWRSDFDMCLAMKNAMLEALSYPDKYIIDSRNI